MQGESGQSHQQIVIHQSEESKHDSSKSLSYEHLNQSPPSQKFGTPEKKNEDCTHCIDTIYVMEDDPFRQIRRLQSSESFLQTCPVDIEDL